jgi:hypothetical protein
MTTTLNHVDCSLPVVEAGALYAECTVVRAQETGDWLAVGTVRSRLRTPLPPAWILVGIGSTAAAAIEDLRVKLRVAERRLPSMA